MTTHNDMIFQFGGQPVGMPKFSSPWATHWFVDGINGNDGTGRGKRPNKAFSTIAAAVAQMAHGDVLYINPKAYVVGTGHARYDELVTIPLAKSNLSIIGAGYPRDNEFGVRLMASASGYCFDVYAPSCHFENIGFFVNGGTGCVIMRNDGGAGLQRGSDGYTFYSCNFKDGTTLCQGGQAGRFVKCVFMHQTGTLTLATPAVSGYGQQLVECHFLDNNGAAVTGPYINASGAHIYNFLMQGGTFQQIPSGAKFYVFGGTLCTGVLAGVHFNKAKVTLGTDTTEGGTNMRVIGCTDESGFVVT